MKGLTLTQPWAQLVALGAKQIETRSWSTLYRGPLLIHAGAGLRPVGGNEGLLDLIGMQPFFDVLEIERRASKVGGKLDVSSFLAFGAIVAVVELVDVRAIWPEIKEYGAHLPECDCIWELTDQERAFGDYTPGRFAWLLANVRPLRQPVPCRGALGLWAAPADVWAAVKAQL